MSTKATTPRADQWTAEDLRRLPAMERDAILAASAAKAFLDYAGDTELTGFDAFGKDDLHGHSSSSQSR